MNQENKKESTLTFKVHKKEVVLLLRQLSLKNNVSLQRD
jgi:hypothetical protein